MLKDFSISLVQCPDWGIEAPPLASALLTGNLKSKGFKVHIFDLNIALYNCVSNEKKKLWRMGEYAFWISEESVKELMDEYNDEIEEQVNKIISSGSQLVGFTLYYTTVTFTLEIIRRVKERSPKTIIVLGGPSANEGKGGLDLLNNPNVDAIVLREGDETLPEMCALFKEKGRLIKIPGLVFKQNGQIINGGERDLISSLDTIPYPDFSDFDLNRYSMPPRLDIFSSRSCVNKCHYCSERNFYLRYRSRSGKSMFEEVSHHLSCFPHLKRFFFADSVMNGILKNLHEFSELLIKNDVNIGWGGAGIIRKDMTPELLNCMAKAGCLAIGYGFETASEKVRKSMNKSTFTNEIAAKVFKDTHNAGIEVNVNFMFGYPTETEKDFQMTLDFLCRNREWIDKVNPAHVFTAVVPDSYLYDNPHEFNLGDDLHLLFWETRDGKNDYLIRSERYERFCRLCKELGYSGLGISEERADKWKILGDYYLHKRNYEKAAECYKDDLLKYGYSSSSVKSFLESCRHGDKVDNSNPFKDLDKLIRYYDNTIKSLNEQIIEGNNSIKENRGNKLDYLKKKWKHLIRHFFL